MDNKPPPTLEEMRSFLEKNPELLLMLGILSLTVMLDKKPPAWLKNLAPINSKVAGPWRGNGSFGHGFGPTKVSHR